MIDLMLVLFLAVAFLIPLVSIGFVVALFLTVAFLIPLMSTGLVMVDATLAGVLKTRAI
jgi:hypothetical protein